jgi:hypothetical protein
MATKKPRIQVTVTRSQYELLSRLAKLQERSMASLLSELVEQVEPVYARVALVLQAAVRAQASAKQGLRAATESAEAEMEPMLAEAMGQLDLLVAAADTAERSAAASSVASAAPAARTPEPVTRGSGLPHTSPKTASHRPKSRVRPRQKRHGVHALAKAIATQVRKGPRGKRP